jgi:hypothetical protein
MNPPYFVLLLREAKPLARHRLRIIGAGAPPRERGTRMLSLRGRDARGELERLRMAARSIGDLCNDADSGCRGLARCR